MSNSDSDTLHIECFHCSKIMRASKAMAGKSGQCPRCGKRIQIPKAKTKSSPPVPEEASPESEAPHDDEEPPVANMTTAVDDWTYVCRGIQVCESRAAAAAGLICSTLFVKAIHFFVMWLGCVNGRERAGC